MPLRPLHSHILPFFLPRLPGTHHSSNVLLVDGHYQRADRKQADAIGEVGFQHGSTEVEQSRCRLADDILRNKAHTIISKEAAHCEGWGGGRNPTKQTLACDLEGRSSGGDCCLPVTPGRGEALRFITSTYQGDPGAAASVRPADVEAQEGGGHDEAEHRDKHHPALQHGCRDPRGCHQDPDKAPKDLQVQVRGKVSVG